MTENNEAQTPAPTPDQPTAQETFPQHEEQAGLQQQHGEPPAYAQNEYAQNEHAQNEYAQDQYAQQYQPQHGAPIGKVRGTGMCILLTIVTFGFYSLYWYYATHDEMKRHSGQGIGGGVALLLAFFVGICMPYINSAEVGGLYERSGRSKPVSGATGLWYFPGMLILVGPIVWFVKTNGALNAYWRSLGAE